MGNDSIILERRFVSEGTFVVKEGEEGNCAYLIQSGSVVVYARHEGKAIELARLEAGQIFGEMALIFDEPRTASVKALEDCNLIAITRNTFKHKLDRSDPTIRAIVEMLTQRVVTANNAVIKKKSDIADLSETARIIYQNILSALPPDRQTPFQGKVMPKMEAFLEAVREFQAGK